MPQLTIPQLLVASPLVSDPEFQRTVIVVIRKSPAGALGFVLTRELALMERYDEILMDGGPVSRGTHFVSIHTGDWKDHTSEEIGEGLYVSAMGDTLDAIKRGQGPDKKSHFSGYAGFLRGELEETVADGIWIPISFDQKFLFDISPARRWSEGMKSAGFDPSKFPSFEFHPNGDKPS